MCQPVFKEHEKLPQTEGCQRETVTSDTGLLPPALELVGPLLPVALQGRVLQAVQELCSYPAVPTLCVKGGEGRLGKGSQPVQNWMSDICTLCHVTLKSGGAGQTNSWKQASPQCQVSCKEGLQLKNGKGGINSWCTALNSCS